MIRTVVLAFLGSIAWSQAAHAQWLDGGAAVCGSTLDERGARCVADGLGHFWIGWGASSPVDTTRGLVRLARWKEAGSPADGWNACGIQVGDTTRASTDFQLAKDAERGVYVAWSERRGQAARILCQHLDPSGAPAPGWPAGGLVLADSAVGPRTPRAFADGNGGVYVAWYEAGAPPDSNTAARVRGVRLSATGALEPGWAEGGKLLLLDASLGWDADADEAGGMLVSGRRSVDGNLRVFVTRLLPDGNRPSGWGPLGNLAADAGGEQKRWQVVGTGAGGAYVLWQEGFRLWIQLLNDTGGVASGWPAAGVMATLSQHNVGPFLPDGAGGAYLGTTQFENGHEDVWLERFGANPPAAAGWPALGFRVTFDGEEKTALTMSQDGTGGVILAWSTSSSALKGQRRLANGTFPAGWQSNGNLLLPDGLVTTSFPTAATSSAGAMLLTWAIRPDGDDWDSQVLLVQGNGDAGSTVDVPPGGPALLTLRAAPNPSSEATAFAFELAGESDVTLHVHDLAGKLVWSQARTSVPAGPSRWSWSGRDHAGVQAPKGMYFARLSTRWGNSRTTVVRM